MVHILWMNGGLGCDGDSVALTAATQPSIEEIALGALPGLPKVAVHWPLIDLECGPETGAENFIEWWHKADRGELEPFVLVVEGSILNEAIKVEGYWCGFGNNPATGQPMTTNEWLDRLDEDRNLEFHIGSGELAEELRDARGRTAGRLIRRWNAVDGVIRLHAERVAGPYGVLRLRLRIENESAPGTSPRTREDGLGHALIAAHSLIGVPGGRFLSMTDPPEWAAAEVAACQNTGTWPVLAGPPECRDLVLSSPVILYDHPEVAAESAGDLFDATEIDEILTLRTLALTESEKRQARATDPRAAELMNRLDDMPPEMLERMHGAIRYLKSGPAGATAVPAAGQPGEERIDWPVPEITGRPSVPWWDPGSDISVSPETDHVVIGGVRVGRGSRVRMRPGTRRADAQDLFLVGRAAVVEAVLHDVDGQTHLAVTPEDDPAADLQRNHGRFLYFAPDEVEPLESAEPGSPPEAAR